MSFGISSAGWAAIGTAVAAGGTAYATEQQRSAQWRQAKALEDQKAADARQAAQAEASTALAAGQAAADAKRRRAASALSLGGTQQGLGMPAAPSSTTVLGGGGRA